MDERELISEAIIRFPALTRLTGLSRSSIYRKELTGTFPRRRRLGPNSVGWITSEVLAWIRDTQKDEPPHSVSQLGRHDVSK